MNQRFRLVDREPVSGPGSLLPGSADGRDPGGCFEGEHSAPGSLAGQLANHSQMQIEGGRRQTIEIGFVS